MLQSVSAIRSMGCLLPLLLCHCVGPTSPFGTAPVLDTQAERKVASSVADPSVEMEFHPRRQVYHDRTNFSLEINSLTGLSDEVVVEVLHNGIDVTSSFLGQAHIHRSHDRKVLIYTIKDMRLKSLDANKIVFRLVDSGAVLAQTQFKAPECSLVDDQQIGDFKKFNPGKDYLKMIDEEARRGNSNPQFLAGIVAQESGFNPDAVSWAKAIGLTQMTPLAEQQVIKSVEGWPRYPGINELSYLTLRSKIYLGEIDDGKEWRLNPRQSLAGGMAYISYLRKYWSRKKNKALLQAIPGDQDLLFSEVVLASYNSGPSRVKRALASKKESWKTHASLKEAYKYIRKVNSYCYHQKKIKVSNDSET